ncbi:uncharacterized protein LOC142974363 [Anticarsia gemmatalis]|uniref:uncharacterized protein LOC142974363 n=1 Tax=Anticarsia gemmatalis TaxID=129554 RepID=UPI003F7731DF
MIFYLLLCHVMFIPFIAGNNITVSKLNTSDTRNKTVTESPAKKLSNVRNVTLVSEGGSILPDTPVLSLVQSFPNTDIEMSDKKVHARKGAFLTTSQEEEQLPVTSVNTTNKITTTGDKPHTAIERLNSTIANVNVTKGESTLNLVKNTTNIVENTNKTVTPTKPTILSYNDLEKTLVKTEQGTATDETHTSSKDVKSYITNPNSHPGMVMPIVITILLVPMFAVLGYMALRRGQEAWKNRHYKRMDFLLDGMYND